MVKSQTQDEAGIHTQSPEDIDQILSKNRESKVSMEPHPGEFNTGKAVHSVFLKFLLQLSSFMYKLFTFLRIISVHLLDKCLTNLLHFFFKFYLLLLSDTMDSMDNELPENPPPPSEWCVSISNHPYESIIVVVLINNLA